MAKVRDEIVGKRFLSVSKSSKLKLSQISEWDWRAGVIRACTHSDSRHPELQILVEYGDVSWQRREWIHVHKEQAFQILLVERTLVFAPQKGTSEAPKLSTHSPALIFDSLVDEVGLSETKDRPVEYLVDRNLHFCDYNLLKNYQDGEFISLSDTESEEAVKRWVAEQDGQRILCTTPSVLVGFRVEVYRSEGTTQWYTAVIVGYNDATRELTVTDDTVLEEHSENPSLVHIRLLGEGVVESILRGENVGITPRRSRSTSSINQHHITGGRQVRREHGTSSRGRKAGLTSKILSSLNSQSPPLSPVGSSSPTSPSRVSSKVVSFQSSSEDHSSSDEHLLGHSLPYISLSPLPKDVISSAEARERRCIASVNSRNSPPVHQESNPCFRNSVSRDTEPTSQPEAKEHRTELEQPSKRLWIEESVSNDRTSPTVVPGKELQKELDPIPLNTTQVKKSEPLTETRKERQTTFDSKNDSFCVAECLPNKIIIKPKHSPTSPDKQTSENKPNQNILKKEPELPEKEKESAKCEDSKAKTPYESQIKKSEDIKVKSVDLCSDIKSENKSVADASGETLWNQSKVNLNKSLKENIAKTEDPEKQITPGTQTTNKDSYTECIVSVSEAKISTKEPSDANTSDSTAPGKILSPSNLVNKPDNKLSATKVNKPDNKLSATKDPRSYRPSESVVNCDDVKFPSNGRVKHFPIVFNNPLESAALGSSVPDRQKLSPPKEGDQSTTEQNTVEPTDEKAAKVIQRTPNPVVPASVALSASNVPSSPKDLSQNPSLVEVPQRLQADYSISVSRVKKQPRDQDGSSLPVPDSLSIVSVSTPVSGTNEEGAKPRGNTLSSLPEGRTSEDFARCGLAGASDAVNGRAVTITATSGPAPPQGNSRVASPPSVSITAVVRSPTFPGQTPATNPTDPSFHHHDGGSGNPQPPQQLPVPTAPYGSLPPGARMDQGDISSDSGVSVTERSVSRSSVLSDDRSSSVEVKPNTPTPAAPKTSLSPLIVDRKESVRVWRNPAVLSQSDYSVRHIHSLQHSAMSQHFPGVAPHIAPPGGSQGVSHAPHPSSAHAAPPHPPSSLPHTIPPQLHFPGHHANAPLHLPPGGLQPSLGAAAAALYPHLQQDVWKQLGHVGSLGPHAYPSLLPRHQEELSFLEQQAREIEKQQADRMHRERREAEVREKQAKEKMERDRVERQRKEQRERRERDERERLRRAEWATESELQLVNKHFEESFRYASQKGSHWSQNLGGLPVKLEPPRDPHRTPSRYQPTSQHGEISRKVKEPEQFVQESIYKAFRADEAAAVDHRLKSQNQPPPPPAHSKHPAEKAQQGIPGYHLHYAMKEQKHNMLERNPYALGHHEKASVIVQPDMKYEKVGQHSVSPKQRPPEQRSSSSYPVSVGANQYKHYESSSRGRSTLSSNQHTVELTKVRQPTSSPHSDRYYPSVGNKPPPTQVPNPYHHQSNLMPANVQNQLHSMNALPSKSKVSSPPPQMYGKPCIPPGVQVTKMEARPAPAPVPMVNKVSMNGPPPAHSGSRGHDTRPPPPTSHEHRITHNQSPFDARHYPAPHPKSASSPALPPLHLHSTSKVTNPPHPQHQGSAIPQQQHPAQTQPLDLGTKDPGGPPSPAGRRRALTPTPQESKRPRLETAYPPSPLLSRVSEPMALYPSAATTITTVENSVTLATLERVASPSTNSQASKVSTASSVITSNVNTANSPSESSSIMPSNDVSRHSTRPPSSTTPSTTPSSLTSTTPSSLRSDDNSSPGNGRLDDSEKGRSPSPSPGGYVHKLKKAWLQRHAGGEMETPSPPAAPSQSIRTATPPPPNPTKSAKPEVKIPVRKQKPLLPALPNGHSEESKDADSSSPSDSEDSGTSKPKRGKTKRSTKRAKKSSESNSDSDKESDGSDDDSGAAKKSEITTGPKQNLIETRRRRGRKPKTKPEKEEINNKLVPKRQIKEEPLNDPLQKPPVSQLKKSGESFLQDRSCYEVAPKLAKCRECRWTAHQRNKKIPNIFCRFYAFRRLRYTKNGQLAVAGFSDPTKDAFGDDLRLWVPDPNSPASDLDTEMSKFLITHVGDQFCDLVQQEKDAKALHLGLESVVSWKRVVQGVREMCDVCETTLFNVHWACSKCGFVVCIDCYKGRKEGTVKLWGLDEGAKERDKFSWLLCASRAPHEQDKLMLTQIIAGDALVQLGKMSHEIRYKWGIPMYCGCPEAKRYQDKDASSDTKKLNGVVSKDILKPTVKKEPKSSDPLVNGAVNKDKNGNDDDNMSNSPLNFFADVALSNDKRDTESSDSDSDDKDDQPSTLRELLTVRSGSKSAFGAPASGGPPSGSKEDSSNSSRPATKESSSSSKKKAKLDTLDDVISCVIEGGVDKDKKTKDSMKVELKHFIRKFNYNRKGREPLPIRIMTKTESRLLYPSVPHSWLCDGKLLRLHESLNENNMAVFQDQWKRGQPVIVSGAGNNLDGALWRPEAFSRDFGDVKNNLINCLTDNIVPNQPMKKFWDGFEHVSKRLKDDRGHPMVLKLKDWPPSDDFAEMLPRRFENLMKSLPMGRYTRRNGSLNLAGRLPECFVRPDLGPKMYIAYGSASHPSRASTNLHLDISDAVNVMCYVGIPKDVDREQTVKDTLRAVDEASCDILTRQRVREKEELPGALWHIYHPRDADKIRDLLNKVAIEQGKKLEPCHDPIHDQSWYLDGPLRERLYKEYAVESYAIVQCMGDALFIPAGAPHQVRNLHNCVKVAEDFVSPENVSHCFHLTQEFRHLSDTHTNHEDKLQIKNIIYHAIKDSIAVLLAQERTINSVACSTKIKTEQNT